MSREEDERMYAMIKAGDRDGYRTARLVWCSPSHVRRVENVAGVTFTSRVRAEGAYGLTLLREVEGDEIAVQQRVIQAIATIRVTR